MSACPSEESLLGLLDDRLHGRKLDEIVVHVETCLRCQEQLETLTRGHGRNTIEPAALGARALACGAGARPGALVECRPGLVPGRFRGNRGIGC